MKNRDLGLCNANKQSALSRLLSFPTVLTKNREKLSLLHSCSSDGLSLYFYRYFYALTHGLSNRSKVRLNKFSKHLSKANIAMIGFFDWIYSRSIASMKRNRLHIFLRRVDVSRRDAQKQTQCPGLHQNHCHLQTYKIVHK